MPRGHSFLLVLLGAGAVRASAQNVTEVQVAPPTITLKVGERYGLLATAYDRVGNVLPAAKMVWTSNNPQVARVDNTGTVVGVGPGVALIEARSGSRRGQAEVQVGAGRTAGGGAAGPPGVDALAGQPPGTGPAAVLRIDPPSVYLLPSEHTRVAPRALREDGSPAAPIEVTWKSLRPEIASVDPSGTVVALAPGQGTIQMSGGGLTATAPVVVQQADFTIREGAAVTLAPGESDTLHVTVPTQQGRSVSPVALTWTSSDQRVARVGLTGVVTAVGSGKATVTVAGFLQQRSIDILVHRAVEYMMVRPTTRVDVEVPLTGTVRFFAEARAKDSTLVPEARVTWSLEDTAVAEFDTASGVLTGKKVGRTELHLTGPGVNPPRAVWHVSVIAGTPVFDARRLGVVLGSRKVIHATFADDTGATLGAASGLAWSSDAPEVAAVREDGTVTGTGYGRAHITATAPGGHSATAEVFVEGELLVAATRGGPPQLYWVERTNLAVLRPAATDSGSAIDPALSPDGSRVAFVSTRDGNPDIYLMDADGTNLRRLTTAPQPDGHPAFSADGSEIVFQSARSGRLGLYAMGLDGGGVHALTADSASQTPTVSPDGRIIAYASVRNRHYHIWLMSPDGSNQRAFTTASAQNEVDPQFLRDGELAYLVERREGNRTVRQVVKADLATGTVTPLTGTDLEISDFAVSPAGDLLALVAPFDPSERRHPVYHVYLSPVGGGAPTAIPAGPTEQMVAPVFLP